MATKMSYLRISLPARTQRLFGLTDGWHELEHNLKTQPVNSAPAKRPRASYVSLRLCCHPLQLINHSCRVTLTYCRTDRFGVLSRRQVFG